MAPKLVIEPPSSFEGSRPDLNDHFGPYADFIPDFKVFMESLQTPLPSAFWVLPNRSNPERVASWFDSCGQTLTPSGWNSLGFTGPDHLSPARSLPYFSGQICVQEEAAWTAAAALGAKPGELVLDMCAAPGAKTTALSAAVGATGFVFASEISLGRITALCAQLARYGLSNVAVCHGDASTHRFPNASFDKILLDAPCSGDGMVRKYAQKRKGFEPQDSKPFPPLQEHLLRRALKLVKPGGRVLYSTCTLNPLENEGVVSRVLEDGTARVVDFHLPGFTLHAGIDTWKKHTFHANCALSKRVYPHSQNTGGFFLALLERNDSLKPNTAPGQAEWSGTRRRHNFQQCDSKLPLQHKLNSFPCSEALRHCDLWRRGSGDKIWACKKPPLPTDDLRLEALGFPVLREMADGRIRPQMGLVRDCHSVEPPGMIPLLNEEQWNATLSNETFTLSPSQRKRVEKNKAVFPLLSFQGFPVAYGILGKNGQVNPQLSKADRALLENSRWPSF